MVFPGAILPYLAHLDTLDDLVGVQAALPADLLQIALFGFTLRNGALKALGILALLGYGNLEDLGQFDARPVPGERRIRRHTDTGEIHIDGVAAAVAVDPV